VTALARVRREVWHLLQVLAGRAPLANPMVCPLGHITRDVPLKLADHWLLHAQLCRCGLPMKPVKKENR
jgi:hypothetical protein